VHCADYACADIQSVLGYPPPRHQVCGPCLHPNPTQKTFGSSHHLLCSLQQPANGSELKFVTPVSRRRQWLLRAEPCRFGMSAQFFGSWDEAPSWMESGLVKRGTSETPTQKVSIETSVRIFYSLAFLGHGA